MPKPGLQNPKAFETLKLRLKELEGKVAKVGWFESSRYESGTPVAYVATIQEFGSGPIPPRPMFRPTIIQEKQSWAQLAGQGAKAILKGGTTAGNVMDALGMRAAGDVAKTIASITAPPLSPITLELRARRARGEVITGRTVGEAARAIKQPGYVTPSVSTKPLVESGIMLNSLTHKVESEKA